MEENHINRIMLYIIAMFLSSCSSNNKVKTFKRGENLIYKTIYDFDRNENTKKGEVYEVYEVDSTQSLKMLTLHRREFISVFRSDSVGSITPSIPTGFLELNHRLYVWREKMPLPLKSDNIKILEKYKILDSSFVKRELGFNVELEDFPLIKTNEKAKGIFYIICRENNSKFLKVESNYRPKLINFSKIDCSKSNVPN